MDPATTRHPAARQGATSTPSFGAHIAEKMKKTLQPWQFTPMHVSYQNPDHKQQHMANIQQRPSNVQQMATTGSEVALTTIIRLQ